MALKLDGLSTSNGSTDPVSFNPDGRNTLFPLIQGFKLLARLSNDILNSPSNEFVRSSNNFPGFHQKTDIQAFPFEHKILLFDLNPTERVRFIKSLEEITIELDNANVCNLRNRMQHNRKPNEFPTQTEIEHTCSVIATTVSKMEKSGICPLIYFYNGQTIDKYHRTEIRLINYRGAVITYHQPSQYRLVLPVSLEKPVIVVPWLHLPNSSEAYRFQFRENSDYVQIWDGYPRRRIRLPTSEVQH